MAGDPFDYFSQPLEGESQAEFSQRLKEEKVISDRIDDDIKAERKRRKDQEKEIVRVLLLGQSESGKSTTLKNFRMTYAPEEWTRERASWRSVVQLNLIRSILTICDMISTASDQHLQIMKLRLAPLKRVELDLRRVLGAAADEEEEVRLDVGKWHDVLRRDSDKDSNSPSSPTATSIAKGATEVIAGSKESMSALWNDERVRHLLAKNSVDLNSSAGFFLDDLDRIASPEYEPSDDDIVRARLRTMGVQEYRVRFDKAVSNAMSVDFGKEWILYDVGGSKTVRHTWIPYFSNVNAIIFLAPISPFDELEPPFPPSLSPQEQITRVSDSLHLFRQISQTQLLTFNTSFVVFLNKCDLLKRKLQKGGHGKIEVYIDLERKKRLTYDGDTSDVKNVIRWFRDRFRDVARKHGPPERVVYLYPTQVTDTKATAVTLNTVRDGILREYLKEADFM